MNKTLKIKEVRVEFKKYSINGEKKLVNRWNELIEFFEYDNTERINEELKRLCKCYEGKRKTFECSYKIISIKEGVI